MSAMKRQMQQAEKIFKNHKAKFEAPGILSWKAPDTSTFAMRAIFDGEYVYISGDIGCAVINLTEEATLKALSSYWKCPSYFVEKVQCSTDLYAFDWNSAREELSNRLGKLVGKIPTDEFDELIFVETDLLEYFTEDSGTMANKILVEHWYSIDPDASKWLPFVGRKLSFRVCLWLTAFKMAYEQIYQKTK